MVYHGTLIRILPGMILLLAVCASGAGAYDETEMAILKMYYRERDLVVSATRHPKPISLVAENVSVVTAEEIEQMNAHSLAEVLNRIPGLFVKFNQDFGSTSLLEIQSSDPRHVLVLLDGTPWNYLNSGSAETHTIPVGIIERIEVVKGPASSSWGSSLGGVIHIITKRTGDAQTPRGEVRTSFGEQNSADHRGEVAGRFGRLGYYLYGGRQDSDGFWSSRSFQSDTVYGKFSYPLSDRGMLTLTSGYCEPEIDLGEFPSQDLTQASRSRSFLITTALETRLDRDVSLTVAFHRLDQTLSLQNDALGLGFTGTEGDSYLDATYDEETTGGGGQMVWETGRHTLVAGADFDRGRLDQTITAGSLLQTIGVPAESASQPILENWGVFVNDTIIFQKWSLTPGFRYDRNSISGSYLSPSLGITYQLDEASLFRASVARGFTLPPLSWTSGGGVLLDPNPDLEPERVWSYQAGLETSGARYFWVRSNVFYNDLENALVVEPYGAGPPTYNDLVVNDGDLRSRGIELELETVAVHHVSCWGGVAYVQVKELEPGETNGFYNYNIGLRYDDPRFCTAQLFGYRNQWEVDPVYRANQSDFIWDLNLTRKIPAPAWGSSEIFLSAHNLFNGSQYTWSENPNPDRWLEVGIRLKF